MLAITSYGVLIPLLVDDPLWDGNNYLKFSRMLVLIPLLVDDPLWAHKLLTLKIKCYEVLIPLLVDDPLWARNLKLKCLSN